MSTAASATPSLTPSRSPTPDPPVQPDHFYGMDGVQHSPPSPDSDGRTWLDPEDDPLAQRGIPVFKPTMEEFEDFEAYMNKIECWGMKSGIVKVTPPKEWTDALPPLNAQLANVKLRSPIEQHMFGRGGLFRQQNLEKRRVMSVREWAELCAKEELRAPGVDDIGLHARANNGSAKARPRRARKQARESETAESDADTHIKEEEDDDAHRAHLDDSGSKSLASSLNSVAPPATPAVEHDRETVSEHGGHEGTADVPNSVPVEQTPAIEEDKLAEEEVEEKPKIKGKRVGQTREAREASLAERAAKDKAFLETFDPHSDWLPPNTTPFDYTPEFCKELERRYWRNCGLGKAAWYGADMQGSLFTSQTTCWNVAHLESALTRLLPASAKGLPGVNTPYLYFGMWRATFAWHVEDMDLFSINYIHFGAPKFWYAVPQARATALEQTMRGYFPKDGASCSQFLRHKSFLASPTLLSQSSCRPNCLVQQAGEFVVTYPKGYHAGFNLGFNCAESVNFALESWLDRGRKARACNCVNFSVRIDVDQLLRDREEERAAQAKSSKAWRIKNEPESSKEQSARKRKAEGNDSPSKTKKRKTKGSTKGDAAPGPAGASSSKPAKSSPTKVTLKLGPKPKEPEVFPCCLCVSMSQEHLLRVQDPPTWRKEGESAAPGADPKAAVWMAHEDCANIVPETWVDEVEVGDVCVDGTCPKELVVFGVDAIVKDRWNLKCSACTKTRHRAHGAPIQCTKGKCPKAFHVSCAREGATSGIIFNVLREVEKEVVITGAHETPAPPDSSSQMPVDLPADMIGMSMPMDHASMVLGAPAAGVLGRPAAGMLGAPSADMFGAPAVSMLGTPVVDMYDVPAADGGEPSGSRVYKRVKKVEVQVLCSQHNPAIAEAKKALKQQKIRNDLLALPPMSRIKLRVSAGVFEVSLLRVIEATGSVEVLWDKGLKREFKWGSVVFGSTDGLTVGQKPTEAAPESDQMGPQLHALQPKPALPHVSIATPPVNFRHHTLTPTSIPLHITPTSTAPSPAPGPSMSTAPLYHPQPASYQSRPTTYQYSSAAWKYNFPSHNSANAYATSGPSTQSYQYTSTAHHNGNAYQGYPGYNYPSTHYQSRGLQWQRPYTGPKNVYSIAGEAASSAHPVPYYPSPTQAQGGTPYTTQPQWTPPPPPSAAAPAVPPTPQSAPVTVPPVAPS